MRTNSIRQKEREGRKIDKVDILLSIGVICAFLIPMIILAHQWFNYGMIWKWEDFLHHENFAIIFFSFGIGIFLSVVVLIRIKTKR